MTQDELRQIADSRSDELNIAWQAMLAVFVILFLLLTWREGLIAGLCIPLTFLGALVVIWGIGLSLTAFTTVPTVMYPQSDGRKLGINIELPPQTTLATSQRLADRVAATLTSLIIVPCLYSLFTRRRTGPA